MGQSTSSGKLAERFFAHSDDKEIPLDALESEEGDLRRLESEMSMGSQYAGPSDPYELNRDIFDNNRQKLETVWCKDSARLNEAIRVYDNHGLSPLHLAFRMGRVEYLDLFVEQVDPKYFSCYTKQRPPFQWTVLDEAIILHNKKYIMEVIKIQYKHRENLIIKWGSAINKILGRTGDIYVEIDWRVKSWIPFASRFLPNDIVKIYKRGSLLRIDTGVNFGSEKLKFGHKSSILYNFEKFGANCVVLVDRKRNMYKIEKFDQMPTDAKINAKVDMLMKSSVQSVDITEKAWFTAELKRGKLKAEQVGRFEALRYTWAGVHLSVHERREHLFKGDRKLSRKQKRASRKSSKNVALAEPYPTGIREPKGSFEQYLARKIYVGRPFKLSSKEKHIRGCLGTSHKFPYTNEKLVEFLRIESEELRQIFRSILDYVALHVLMFPHGFPTYLEVPVVPTTKFFLKLTDFQWKLPEGVETNETFFEIPDRCARVEKL